MSNEYYVSLGAGKNQLPLIKAAHDLGLRIIGIDQNPSAAGMGICDLKIQESIDNYRKIFYKINSLWFDGEIVGGYCASFGSALLSWSYLAEKLKITGLARPIVERLLDKYEVRKKCRDILEKTPVFFQPGFIAGKSPMIKKDTQGLDFPMIIKPRSGWGKSNIRQVNNPAELKSEMGKKSLKLRGLAPESLMVEEKIEGDEITVTGFVQNFRFLLICITDKITSSEAPFIELEHRFPSRHLDLSLKISEAHQEIIHAMQITDTPIVSEWKIKDGQLYLIEISAQIPGENIASYLIPKAMGYDYFKNLVKLTLGQPVELLPSINKSRPCIIKYIPEKPSENEIAFMKQNCDMFEILNKDPHVPPLSNYDRYGVSAYLG